MAGKLKINELYIRDIREAEQNALKWDSINRELPAAITTYSKASCLKFCRKLHSTLPRELRDLVYEHLCNREYSIGVGPRRTMPFASHTHHDAHRKAHYLDPSFVDTEMSIEIAEAYYRTNCFRIYDSYQLKNFLTDTTLNNIAPALFLRRMTVELRGDIREVVDYGFTVDRVWRSCEALRKSLQILFCISRMKSFDLEILVSAHCDKVLNNILESLRPTYQRLKQFGFNVEVTFHKFEAYLHMKHLTHFFECTRAEWDALVRSYRQASRIQIWIQTQIRTPSQNQNQTTLATAMKKPISTQIAIATCAVTSHAE
ncbi:hypothetical protein K469DRAFT_280732 [Zopfia rhizophila CBS 207.26]|uniref:Uncharacterized protein n=1 Tax=Zopfia rhizophila CBS 207.26 TaxID=1314779 RepID=A0A6A6EP52_9PEZI|nr:hypothetical protein K469DRAFT_280732 [Zopfia rhizophila CBS 207.26]